jgi:hypothetical protein
MANLETISARVLEENSIIERRFKPWSFNVARTGPNRNVRQPINFLRALRLECNSVLIRFVAGGFGDAKEFSDEVVRSLKLQPPLNFGIASEAERRQQCFVKPARGRHAVYTQINMVESTGHDEKTFQMSEHCAC